MLWEDSWIQIHCNRSYTGYLNPLYYGVRTQQQLSLLVLHRPSILYCLLLHLPSLLEATIIVSCPRVCCTWMHSTLSLKVCAWESWAIRGQEKHHSQRTSSTLYIN